MNETLLLAAAGPLMALCAIAISFIIIEGETIVGGMLTTLGGMALLGSLLGYEAYPTAWAVSLFTGAVLAAMAMLENWHSTKKCQQRG